MESNHPLSAERPTSAGAGRQTAVRAPSRAPRKHGNTRAELREALQALLDMAEAVVSTELAEETTTRVSTASTGPRAVGRRLAELTRSLLGCTRVAIVTIDETGRRHPVAAAGLTRSDERRWRGEQENLPLGEARDLELAARFFAGETVVADTSVPPFDLLPNPNGVPDALVAPLRIGERLIGILALDYAREEHEFGPQEITLASAMAKLAALVLERQRLLRERAAAEASALALREAKERMDVFLSIAGHELRTPITSMKATIQLAERQLRSIATPEAIAASEPEDLANKLSRIMRQLDRANRQSDRLDRLVSDLLDVSRIQAGKLELRRERCDLSAVVFESVEEQRLLHPNRSIRFEAPRDEVVVVADPDRIGQVVTNYLTNALKYSSAECPVAVRVCVEGAHAHVAVTDQGPGLPAVELERIWDRFHRVASVRQRGAGVGLGLGLYISRGIIERHGGTFDVESQVGKGSTFSFTLPLVEPDARSDSEPGA